MIHCKDVFEEASDFLDGELEPARHDLYQAHLEACPPCHDFYRTFETTVRRAKEALVIEPPPELEEALVRTLREAWRKGA